MKRVGHLFEQIVAWENLLLAYHKARRGKREQRSVIEFTYRQEGELLQLQRELREGSYQPEPLREFWITDPKKRLISAAPFRDRVVHHALCNVIEPVFDRTFIYHSYSCRTDKGTHKAAKQYQRWSRQYRYVLKGDVQKFFPSMDIEVLRTRIHRRIKCGPTLALIDKILAVRGGECIEPTYFPGDTLFSPWERERGLPIGSLTSQLFANVYLDMLDQHVTRVLGEGHYLRYTDDLVVMGNDKARLWDVRDAMVDFLATELRLVLHQNKSRVFRTSDGLTFLGYRIWPRRMRVRAENVHRIRRRLRKMVHAVAQGQKTWSDVKRSLRGWEGYLGQANSRGLRQKLFGELVSP